MTIYQPHSSDTLLLDENDSIIDFVILRHMILIHVNVRIYCYAVLLAKFICIDMHNVLFVMCCHCRVGEEIQSVFKEFYLMFILMM